MFFGLFLGRVVVPVNFTAVVVEIIVAFSGGETPFCRFWGGNLSRNTIIEHSKDYPFRRPFSRVSPCCVVAMDIGEEVDPTRIHRG